MEVYDVGYMTIKDPALLHKAIVELGAVLVDVRFSPRSRDPDWNIGKLKELYGDRYLHLKELGNENYRGGPIKIVDLPKGVNRLIAIGKPIVLMCGCWKRDECHRHYIVKWLDEAGIATSTALDLKAVKEIATRREPKQAVLFSIDLE